jgi:hypothetical protein
MPGRQGMSQGSTEPTPASKKKPLRFGWCSDGHHENCIKITPTDKIKCECNCHD